MRLISARITEFQSVFDSNEFEIDDITCLVGKNESGKTALLKALYRLNPVEEIDHLFDVTDDYPRGIVIDYQDDVESGRREDADVVEAKFALEQQDIDSVEEVFGPDCLKGETPTVTLCKGYSNEITVDGPNVDEKATTQFLIKKAGLPQELESEILGCHKVAEMVEMLEAFDEPTTTTLELADLLKKIDTDELYWVVYSEILDDCIPKFLYFDEYYLMSGEENLDALKNRVDTNSYKQSDFPLLGLVELARLRIDALINPGRTEALVARLEAAGNTLTRRFLRYWSQNKDLRMRVAILKAQPNDPEGMTSGTNIWARIENTRRSVSTTFGTRSRGFVWFFSFLAWYSRFQRRDENVILLFDEPGLFLHAKAQEDLLRYFEQELKAHHQVIYTTHSPFMVDPRHFDRVRIVQDLSIETDDDIPEEEQGTKVTDQILEATPDSLFPLQGALGYEIYQSLFVGPNSLVVEGPSDLLYINAVSSILERRGEDGLNPAWTVTPVGGSDKVPTFVALLGAQGNLNVAILIDYQKKDRQIIENLYKGKLIERANVLTFADFVPSEEADIEDLFAPEFYLKLVNEEFGLNLTEDVLPSGHPRILRRIEMYLEDNRLPKGQKFNHYRPARYFNENIKKLENELTDDDLEPFRNAIAAINRLL